MRILLTNYFLDKLTTGSETWTMTIADYLKREHDVDVSNYEGLKENEIKNYDLALINHTPCLDILKDKSFKKIFTSHGVYPSIEQPTKGADIYVSISEEVQEHLKQKGFESVIIRNGIDCRRFKPTRPINKLTNVLMISGYQSSIGKEMAKAACQLLNLNFKIITNIKEVEKEINWADLVISLGRGCYEAMACGRAVIVWDKRGYDKIDGADGIVTPEDMIEFRKCNCSGRTKQKEWGVPELLKEMKKYDPQMGQRNREYILKNNDIINITKQYLDL